MTRFTLIHELACAEETFWALFLDDAFNVRLYASLGFPRWEVLGRTETAEAIVRRVAGTPVLNAPAFVAKLFKGGPSYDEEGTFDKRSRQFSFTMISSALAREAKITGLVRCEPLGPRACRRVLEASVEVALPALGGAVERVFESALRANWGESVHFLNDAARRRAPLASGLDAASA
jgi:hypothetical protein